LLQLQGREIKQKNFSLFIKKKKGEISGTDFFCLTQKVMYTYTFSKVKAQTHYKHKKISIV